MTYQEHLELLARQEEVKKRTQKRAREVAKDNFTRVTKKPSQETQYSILIDKMNVDEESLHGPPTGE